MYLWVESLVPGMGFGWLFGFNGGCVVLTGDWWIPNFTNSEFAKWILGADS